MRDRNGTKVLVRSRRDRMAAGVCAGAAEYFGIDVTLVRVIVAVVAVISGGAGALAYLAAWVIIPEEGETTPIAGNIASTKQDASAGRWPQDRLPALTRGGIMNCPHQPPCPPADAPDCEAAHVVAAHPEQGWSLLCNGVVVFEDTGDLLPDGRIVAPHRAAA